MRDSTVTATSAVRMVFRLFLLGLLLLLLTLAMRRCRNSDPPIEPFLECPDPECDPQERIYECPDPECDPQSPPPAPDAGLDAAR